MTTALLKEEFSVHNIWFTFPKPEAFYFSQWKWPQPVFIIYRLLVAIFSTACLLNYIIVMTTELTTEHNLMVYLTTWTSILFTGHFNLAAVVSVYCHCKLRRNVEGSAVLKSISAPDLTENPPSPVGETVASGTREEGWDLEVSLPTSFTIKMDQTRWYMKLSWFVFELTAVSAVVVCLVYFTGVYPHLSHVGLSFVDLSVHGLSAGLVLVEVSLTAYPVRLLHALYPMLYGLLYIIFNLSYWSHDADENVVYEGVLDWNYPGKAILLVLVLAFVVTPLLQLLHFALYRLRLRLYRRIYREVYVT